MVLCACLSHPMPLQPMDASVFGPLKKHIASAQDAWVKNNPGKAISIYDLPQIAAAALPKANAQENIINGF